MSGPSILVLGRRVRPLERIAVLGEVLGLKSRATAFRLAERDAWPMVGTSSHSRYVIVPALLARLGIPYECDAGPDTATRSSWYDGSRDERDAGPDTVRGTPRRPPLE